MYGTVAQVIVAVSLLLGEAAFAQEKIKITSSTYGADDQNKKDCTAAVKGKCEEQVSCTFVPDDDICGDPAPGQASKVLVTGFMCGFLSL